VQRVDVKFIAFEYNVKAEVYVVLRNTTMLNDITEIRWKVLKAMLDDFPQLKRRTKKYLQAHKK